MHSGKLFPVNEELVTARPDPLERLSDYRDRYIPARTAGNAFLDTWRIINKHRALILACLVISVTLTGIAAFRMTRM